MDEYRPYYIYIYNGTRLFLLVLLKLSRPRSRWRDELASKILEGRPPPTPLYRIIEACSIVPSVKAYDYLQQ